ncbi:MAG TPA: NUDIX domain-containing protein [Methylococcus sp.]|nr:NUDIX domain-containing protein [Methylococcus sp.]
MEREFDLQQEEQLYCGFFHLKRLRLRHTLHAGGWSGVLTRELYSRHGGVAVVPYDPVSDRVVLIEQFRVGPIEVHETPWLMEIVAGALEPGDDPEVVACREMWEEAGCEVRDLIRIYEFFTSPGASSEKITLYCGIVDASEAGGVHGLAEEGEDILVCPMPFADAYALLERGGIGSAIPIIGLQWLAAHRQRLRERYA